MTVALPFAVLPRLLPLHWIVWEGLLVKGILIDVYGHCGIDCGPWHPFKLTQYSLLPRLPWRSVFLHNVDHDEHHRLGKGNYALYLRLWDGVCDTELPPPKAAR